MSPMVQTDWVPERLGRYDVIGELATGGMAQILLAKPSEPGGFNNLVVLKRILPHLADDKAFVQMFLDEARIVSALDHPNVVHVHEMEETPDGRFMVMEFLDGESLFGIMRRLTRLKRDVGHDIAIHVVAEACSGLHAAHELRDEHDEPLSLVHRDVSPHNLLVTYSGKLKVIDFGIAKTENRITRTETGQLKGKFEYMSPEQCAAQPVDRRSDVYALGIVLYELVTGRRLFKRANELLTIKAVTEQPIIPPTELNPECSPDLEAICVKALEREPKDRFQTCAEMRRALLKVLRAEHRSPKLPEDQMRELMQGIFGDRIAEKRGIVEAIRQGTPPAKLPKPEVDLQFAFPEISDDILRAHTHTRKAGATAVGSRRRGPRSTPGGSRPQPSHTPVGASVKSSPRLETPAGPAPSLPSPPSSSTGTPVGPAPGAQPGGLSPAGAQAGAHAAPPTQTAQPAHAGGASSAPPARVSRRSHLAAGIGVASAVIAVGILLLVIAQQPAEQLVPVAAPAQRPSAPAQANVTLQVSSQPPGATVFLDGARAGVTPVNLAVPRSGVSLPYRLQLTGYQEHRGTLVPVASMPVHAVLQPVPAPTPSPAPEEGAGQAEGAEDDAAKRERRLRRRARRQAAQAAQAAQEAPGRPAPPKATPAAKGDPFRRFE